MSTNPDWLEAGLDALPPATAQRIRLLRTLLATSTLLRLRLDQELASGGITSQQGALLQFIEAQPQPPTMGQVAEGLSMSHQNVKQIALVLQRKGFVDITVDAQDRRARRLVLTEHHHSFWRQRNPADFSSVQDWLSVLDDREVAQTVAALSRLRHSLKRS
jgi:DNA-binding MarR family transcriptional regulator